MEYHSSTIIVALIVLVAVVVPSLGCDPRFVTHGCTIHRSQCICGVGCKSEFRYANRDDCKRALKGKGYDVCTSNPCANYGVCVQTSNQPWYKCRCEGTGFYGPRCQYECPTSGTSLKVFPHECIII